VAGGEKLPRGFFKLDLADPLSGRQAGGGLEPVAKVAAAQAGLRGKVGDGDRAVAQDKAADFLQQRPPLRLGVQPAMGQLLVLKQKLEQRRRSPLVAERAPSNSLEERDGAGQQRVGSGQCQQRPDVLPRLGQPGNGIIAVNALPGVRECSVPALA